MQVLEKKDYDFPVVSETKYTSEYFNNNNYVRSIHASKNDFVLFSGVTDKIKATNSPQSEKYSSS
jgi:hypothetical protein